MWENTHGARNTMLQMRQETFEVRHCASTPKESTLASLPAVLLVLLVLLVLRSGASSVPRITMFKVKVSFHHTPIVLRICVRENTQ